MEITLLYGIVGIMVVISVFLVSKKYKETKAKSEQHFGEVNPFKHPNRHLSTTHNGRNFSLHYHTGSKKNPQRLVIETEVVPVGNFEISKESKLDKLSKKIGLSREFQTGDPTFDSEFFVTSEDHILCSEVFTKSGIKELIRSAIKDSAIRIILKGNKLTLKISPVRIQSFGETGFGEAAYKVLDAIAEALPAPSSVPKPISPISTIRWSKIITLSPYILAITGIGLLISGLVVFEPVDTMPILQDSLKWAGILFFGYILASYSLLKGRSSAHRELLIIFIVGLIACPLVAFGGAATLNGISDINDPQIIETQVTRKWEKTGRNKKLVIEVESWNPLGERKTFTVGRALYDAATPGASKLRLLVKPGSLGYPWIESKEIIS